LTCVSWSTFRFCLEPKPPNLIGCCIFRLPSYRSATCAAYRSSSSLSCQSPACAFDQPSSCTFRPSLRLASAANLPASPSDPTSDSHRLLKSSGAAFRLTCGFRRRSTIQPCLRTQLPTFIECRALRLCLPANPRLASPISLPACLPINLRLASPINLPVLGKISQLSPGYLLAVKRRRFHMPPPDH